MRPEDLDDPWLVSNARRDVTLGFDPGIMDGHLDEATPSPTSRPTVAPQPEPVPTTTATQAVPEPTPTATPTPKPTPKPTLKPTPKPGLAKLSLEVTACPGAFFVLDWSAAPADGFGHYQTLRSTSGSIAPTYPPKRPAVAPKSLYTPDRGMLRALDVTLEPGATFYYRTVAFKPDDVAYAASGVVSASAQDVKALGPLAALVEGGSVQVAWSPYDGPEACFTWSKLVLSTTNEAPSYFDGADAVWASESQAAGTATVDGLAPGTYYLRLQTLRSSDAGKLLVAQTDALSVTIP